MKVPSLLSLVESSICGDASIRHVYLLEDLRGHPKLISHFVCFGFPVQSRENKVSFLKNTTSRGGYASGSLRHESDTRATEPRCSP